jgi:hypothetical protein
MVLAPEKPLWGFVFPLYQKHLGTAGCGETSANQLRQMGNMNR